MPQLLPQAIAPAPEPEKGGRGKKSPNGSKLEQFNKARLSETRSILREFRPFAESVLKGKTPFDDALETIRQQEQRSSSAPQKRERVEETSTVSSEKWLRARHRREIRIGHKLTSLEKSAGENSKFSLGFSLLCA